MINLSNKEIYLTSGTGVYTKCVCKLADSSFSIDVNTVTSEGIKAPSSEAECRDYYNYMHKLSPKKDMTCIFYKAEGEEESIRSFDPIDCSSK